MAHGTATGFASGDSAAERLASSLRHAIAEGMHPPYAPLPSYRELAKSYGVSLWTVKSALDILEREDLVMRQERRGTFARRPLAPSPPGAAPLRCLNVVEDTRGEAYEFVHSDHLAGYTEALEDGHVKLRFVSTPGGGVPFDSVLSPLYPVPEQGCIVAGGLIHDLLSWLRRSGMAFAVHHHQAYPWESMPEHHKAFANKTAGAFEAVRHLLSLGHRRIGFLGQIPQRVDDPEGTVYTGFRSALACAGLAPAPEDLADAATDDFIKALDLIRGFFERSSLPTAVLAQTDAMAIAAVRMAKERGLSVPGDLSVVGFNARSESAAADPPLTTVATPRRQLARTAAEMVLLAARGAFEAPQTRILECKLVIRASTGPPKGTGGPGRRY